MKCKLCGKTIADSGTDPSQHIKIFHEMSPWEYWLFPLESKECLRCGKTRYPGSPLVKNFLLPCSCTPRKEALEYVQLVLKEFFDNLSSSKMAQVFLGIPGILEYLPEKDIFGLSKTKHGLTKSGVYTIDFAPGYPKLITADNMDGIIFVLSMNDTRWNIPEKPEICKPDPKHYGRYNILNLGASGSRYTKKLNGTSGKCYKFFNTSLLGTKSIFSNRSQGVPEEVTRQKTLYSRSLMSIIQDIYLEILKNSDVIEDHVFLHTRISLPGTGKNIHSRITWFPEYKDTDTINISIYDKR